MEQIRLDISSMAVSMLQENVYLVSCPATHEAIVIDPGDDPEMILYKIQQLELKVQYILATHGHFDHIGGVDWLQKKLQVPFYIHADDLPYVKSCKQTVEKYRMPFQHMEVPTPTSFLQDQQELKFGTIVGKAIHTPGHTPGGMSFLFGNHLFDGDTLLAGAVGRTDLPGGSFATLENSIRQKLYTLPSEVIVYPGHGPTTTIGYEKENNYYINAAS